MAASPASGRGGTWGKTMPAIARMIEATPGAPGRAPGAARAWKLRASGYPARVGETARSGGTTDEYSTATGRRRPAHAAGPDRTPRVGGDGRGAARRRRGVARAERGAGRRGRRPQGRAPPLPPA